MLITNLINGKTFDCISFESRDCPKPEFPIDANYSFTLGFSFDEQKRFFEDCEQKEKQYYTLLHEYEEHDNIEPKVLRITQFFTVTAHTLLTGAVETFFWKPGHIVFYCKELDNFGKIAMIKDLQERDPNRDWREILDEEA